MKKVYTEKKSERHKEEEIWREKAWTEPEEKWEMKLEDEEMISEEKPNQKMKKWNKLFLWRKY